MGLRHRITNTCNPAVMDALENLRAEYAHSPHAQRTIEDGFIFYAIHGRDRAKLDQAWVDRARERAEETIEFEKMIERMRSH